MARKRRMSELGAAFLSAKFSTAIQQLKWPCEWQWKFIIVGSVPSECCEIRNGQMASKCFETEADACKAIEAAGVKQYQLADCSWVGR